jgi:hypothetical protein
MISYCVSNVLLGQNNFGPIVHDEECFVTSEAVSVGSVIGMIVAANSVCFLVSGNLINHNMSKQIE